MFGTVYYLLQLFFTLVIASWIAAVVFWTIWERKKKEFDLFLNSSSSRLLSGESCMFDGDLYSLDTPLVQYTFCTSVLVMTFTRSSCLCPAETSGRSKLICILLTVFGGWWGIPWGPVYSVKALIGCASPEVITIGELFNRAGMSR